jgi:hypothetical protein
MTDDRETPKPRPHGPDLGDPGPSPDRLQEAGDRFTRLSMT